MPTESSNIPNEQATNRFTYRLANPDDAQFLQRVGSKCFYDTFIVLDHSHEDLTDYIQEAYAPAQLEKEIRNINEEFYYIVIDNSIRRQPNSQEDWTTLPTDHLNPQQDNLDCVIGFLKCTWGKSQTEEEFRDFDDHMQLQRLYVRAEYQSQRIGGKLMDYAMEFAKSHVNPIFKTVWLTVYIDNPRAIKFYERYGFVHDGQYSFEFASGPKIDYIYKHHFNRD